LELERTGNGELYVVADGGRIPKSLRLILALAPKPTA
jgi:hypothetical protein